ncbi:MAG: hypothetical protein AAF441_05825 [Pseudomonadota bacterium]
MGKLWKNTLPRGAAGLAISVAFLGLTACADVSSIFRTTMLDGGFSPVTDAKQRLISNNTANVHHGRNHPKRILCTEPSPDVASALSAAAAAAGQSGGDSAAGGFSQAEGVAQLGERLATIQLLRDGLYRACEAYQNGAISQTMYALIVSRADRMSVALLSSEMAAGAFGRRLAAISGSASSAAGQSGASEDAINTAQNALETAEQNLEEAKGVQETRQTAFDEDQDPTKANTKGPLEEANGEVRKNQKIVDQRRQDLQRLQSASASTFAQALAEAGGGITSGVGAEGSKAVVQIHKQYADSSPVGPLMVACIHALSTSYPKQHDRTTSVELGDYATKGTDVYGQETELTEVCRGLFKRDRRGTSTFLAMLRSRQKHKLNIAKLDADSAATTAKARRHQLEALLVSQCLEAGNKDAPICQTVRNMRLRK